MTHTIEALKADDLEKLCGFLTAGFHTAPGADFATVAVLRWKYLQSRADGQGDFPRSYLAQDEAGTIIGHVGLCPTRFEGPGIMGGAVSTLHMIDWLGSPGHRAVGTSLMRRAHEAGLTQFGLGGSDAGRAVIKRGGYKPREPVPVYQRILRPSYRFRGTGLRLAQGSARVARDLTRNLLRPLRRARACIELRRVGSFADGWVAPIVEQARCYAILTGREPARLDHLLSFPLQTMSGWQIIDIDGPIRGFALLNIVTRDSGAVRMGTIVDCVMAGTDPDLWHASFFALTRELKRQGADIAQAFGGPSFVAEGLSRAGFVSRFALEFSLRDRQGLIPRDVSFHLMPIEADYGYT